MAYDNVLTALADPTRRTMFERLRRRAYTVGELADHVGVRQPTATQHLRVLRRAKLVRDRREGTRRYYSASLDGLQDLRSYLDSLWDDVLTAYAAADDSPPARRVRAKR